MLKQMTALLLAAAFACGAALPAMAEQATPETAAQPDPTEWADEAQDVDISRKGADKGAALELIQRKLGISPEETMVFGDQMNDAEMMRQARFSYAVANAVPEIRAMAAFEAPSNQENGVMQVLGKLLEVHAPQGGAGDC